MSETAPSLYDSFALYCSGVTLVSVRDDDDHRFFVAGSVLTASVEPFAVAVSVAGHRDALPAITAGKPWTVSILATRHLPLVRRLTARTTPAERLMALQAAGVDLPSEGPIWVPDALVTLWCTTLSTTPVHDQILLVGQVQHGTTHQAGAPLVRWNREFGTVIDLPIDGRDPRRNGTGDQHAPEQLIGDVLEETGTISVGRS